MRLVEEKSPSNRRPIGIEIVGEHLKKDKKRLPHYILQAFIYPSSQDSVGSFSSLGQVAKQGCRCQRQ